MKWKEKLCFKAKRNKKNKKKIALQTKTKESMQRTKRAKIRRKTALQILEILKMPTGHEEVQDKHLVFQDIRDMLKIVTGHEEDAG